MKTEDDLTGIPIQRGTEEEWLSPGRYFVVTPEGPTLRDQFAMAALTGYISADTEYQCPATHLAEWSYDVADAMLEAREK